MTITEIDERIAVLEGRQNDLLSAMAESDAHASKCTKLGLDFAQTYPNDLATYEQARTEFNANEHEIATLKEQRFIAEQDEERPADE